MKYTVQIHSKAGKNLLSLPSKDKQKIAALIDQLASEPRPDGCRKLKDKNNDLYRLRSGDYRIVYQVKDKVLTVLVLKIGRRDEIYKGIISSRRK